MLIRPNQALAGGSRGRVRGRGRGRQRPGSQVPKGNPGCSQGKVDPLLQKFHALDFQYNILITFRFKLTKLHNELLRTYTDMYIKSIFKKGRMGPGTKRDPLGYNQEKKGGFIQVPLLPTTPAILTCGILYIQSLCH